MEIETLLGLSERGFFIPFSRAADATRFRREGVGGAVEQAFLRAETEIAACLSQIDAFGEALRGFQSEAPPAPRFDQDFLPPLDAALLYATIRRFAPSCVIEIGSGHSTRFIARAIKDGGLETDLFVVDPAPKKPLEGLGAIPIPAPVQDAPLAPFEALKEGDVLFVDSSHVLMPGSDVDAILNRILPALGPGVLVHFHDIFLPDDYPPSWRWRGYNEQNAVASLVLHGGFDVLFASHFAERQFSGEIAASVVAGLPHSSAPNSSLWLRKTTERATRPAPEKSVKKN